jgi:hypothetical protein
MQDITAQKGTDQDAAATAAAIARDRVTANARHAVFEKELQSNRNQSVLASKPEWAALAFANDTAVGVQLRTEVEAFTTSANEANEDGGSTSTLAGMEVLLGKNGVARSLKSKWQGVLYTLRKKLSIG